MRNLITLSVRNDVPHHAVTTSRSHQLTTNDAFLDGRIRVLQPKSGPRTAIDALFLAAAVPAMSGASQRVLEAGAGSGVVSLALCARVEDVRVTGVETQSGLCELARENAVLNAMDDRLVFLEGDVTARWEQLEGSGLKRENFDHVVANPPFFNDDNVRRPANAAAAKAHSFSPDDLEKWVRFLATTAAPHGTLTMIHRPEALKDLLLLLEGRFGALKVFPLFPKRNFRASRVLIQGTKASRAPLELLAGMVLHEDDGSYTTRAQAILRDAAALDLDAVT